MSLRPQSAALLSLLLLGFAHLGLSSRAPLGAQDPEPERSPHLRQMQEELFDVAERVRPSIVTVAAYVRDHEAFEPVEAGARWIASPGNEYPGFRLIGSGSGVVIDENGSLLTNRHFLLKPNGEPCDLVDVETVDNRHTISRIVGMEPTLNMAVLALEVYSEQNPPRFSPIEFANSGLVEPGHWAIAMGDPFGPEKHLSLGLLSATPSRECYQEQLMATYLQFVAPVHPGALGGALVDAQGGFLGMLVPGNPELALEDAPQLAGLGFALPSNIIQGLYATIQHNESVRSPWLGFAIMSMAELWRERGPEGMAQLERPRTGVYIENVFDPSPAQAAGVQVGDFLVSFDGKLLGTPIDFQRALYMAGIGSTVELELFRAGETYTVEVPIEVRPAHASTR